MVAVPLVSSAMEQAAVIIRTLVVLEIHAALLVRIVAQAVGVVRQVTLVLLLQAKMAVVQRERHVLGLQPDVHSPAMFHARTRTFAAYQETLASSIARDSRVVMAWADRPHHPALLRRP